MHKLVTVSITIGTLLFPLAAGASDNVCNVERDNGRLEVCEPWGTVQSELEDCEDELESSVLENYYYCTSNQGLKEKAGSHCGRGSTELWCVYGETSTDSTGTTFLDVCYDIVIDPDGLTCDPNAMKHFWPCYDEDGKIIGYKETINGECKLFVEPPPSPCPPGETCA